MFHLLKPATPPVCHSHMYTCAPTPTFLQTQYKKQNEAIVWSLPHCETTQPKAAEGVATGTTPTRTDNPQHGHKAMV